jgi:hypothetical protein
MKKCLDFSAFAQGYGGQAMPDTQILYNVSSPDTFKDTFNSFNSTPLIPTIQYT